MWDWQPIVGFPAEELWLQFAGDPGTADGCSSDHGSPPGGIFVADGPTDAEGWTAFVAPLDGGGWSPGPVTVYLIGEPAQDPDLEEFPPLPLRCNSPDVNGDLTVTLPDIAAFAQDLADDDYRSDLNWDGVISLVDVALFTTHLAAECP